MAKSVTAKACTHENPVPSGFSVGVYWVQCRICDAYGYADSPLPISEDVSWMPKNKKPS
jgi:hypothetical protein